MSPLARPDSASTERTGFALGLVVFFLFAIGMAGAAGYQIVFTESSMASSALDGQKALVAARAGLSRFMSEQIGVIGDTVAYAIGDAVVTVTAKKVYQEDDYNDMYYVRSEAEVTDPRYPDTPASRVVGTYAWHRKASFQHRAAVMIATTEIEIENGGDIIGLDAATSSDCSGGGVDITGAISNSIVDERSSGNLEGSPQYEIYSGGYSAMYDSVGLRWDILQDPNFPVEFEDSPPNWASLPSDSFPLIRYNGDLNAGFSWSGRGVLIVTGEFDARNFFYWNGIILAGSVNRRVQPGQIYGLVIGALDGTNPASRVEWRGDIQYNSCYVYSAAQSLSYLEPVPNAVFEAN